MNLNQYLNSWENYLVGHDNGESISANNARGLIYKEMVWGHYEGTLEKMFPRLLKFQNFDWADVAREYFTLYPPTSYDLNQLSFQFPDFLLLKANLEVLPYYLYEIALYEIAEFQVYTSHEKSPDGIGVYLNPTCQFLDLKYDVAKMIQTSEKSEIEIIKKPNLLCIARNHDGLLKFIELNAQALELLLPLEDAPLVDPIDPNDETFKKLVAEGIIIWNK